MASSLVLLALTAATAVHAAVVPTAPGPGAVFQAGGACSYSYTPDTTGTWRNVSIDLMTGSNFDMVVVENIASGIDGTSAGGATGTGTFTCPQVSINAAVYFLQFTNDGADPTWTTRFTIASSSGATQAAPSTTRIAGSAIGYGFGSLAGDQPASTGGASASATGGAQTATATADAVTVTSTDSSYSPPSGSSGSDSSSTSSASSSDSSSSSSHKSGAQSLVAGLGLSISAALLGLVALML